MRSRGQSRTMRVALSSSPTTSVSRACPYPVVACSYFSGLISQVAEELWEVKDRKIRNLTKEDISIVDYKKLLMKDSEYR